MIIYCHLFVQIADYLALAFHMLSTIPTEKTLYGNSSNGIIIPTFLENLWDDVILVQCPFHHKLINVANELDCSNLDTILNFYEIKN